MEQTNISNKSVLERGLRNSWKLFVVTKEGIRLGTP